MANENGAFRCATCQRKSPVLAGTIFQGTRKPLRLWFQVIWWKRHLKVYHLFARSENGMMVQILSGLIAYLLLTIYCHEEHGEQVLIRRVRQLRNKIPNAIVQQVAEQAVALQKQKRRCSPKHRKWFGKAHATF